MKRYALLFYDSFEERKSTITSKYQWCALLCNIEIMLLNFIIRRTATHRPARMPSILLLQKLYTNTSNNHLTHKAVQPLQKVICSPRGSLFLCSTNQERAEKR